MQMVHFHSPAGEAFQSGVRMAAERFGLRAPEYGNALEETSSQLQSAVEKWPFEVSSRFIQYIGEIIGVAAVAREVNGYPKLTQDQIVAYLAHSADILDSLKHA
jgi:hypothetical protein